jgi:FtsP/CotA-like multicopper oxidase with cupredoxin domain
MGQVPIEFAPQNAGQWALHRHNIYYAEAGMVSLGACRAAHV